MSRALSGAGGQGHPTCEVFERSAVAIGTS